MALELSTLALIIAAGQWVMVNTQENFMLPPGEVLDEAAIKEIFDPLHNEARVEFQKRYDAMRSKLEKGEQPTALNGEVYRRRWKIAKKGEVEVFHIKFDIDPELRAEVTADAALKVLHTDLPTAHQKQYFSVAFGFDPNNKFVTHCLGECVYSIEEIGALATLTNFIDGVDLRELCKADHRILTVKRVRFILAELLALLHYVHKCGLVAGDLKPDNVMFDRRNGHAVLVDTGHTHLVDEADVVKGMGGTPGYRAEELLDCISEMEKEKRELQSDIYVDDVVGGGDGEKNEKKVPKPCKYDRRADFRALGATAYFLIHRSREAPPEIEGTKASRVLNWHEISSWQFREERELQNLVQTLLEPDPNKRPSDILSIMAHPFFDGVNWKAVATRNTPSIYDVSHYGLLGVE